MADAIPIGEVPFANMTERLRLANSADVPPRRAELHRLSDAVRRTIERLVATEAPIDVLAEAADRLEAAAELLEGHPQGRVYEGFAESANAGNPHSFFDHSPIMGRANPLAPPLELEVRDDQVLGRAVFGSAYEGPPGCVHGGYIAAAFDEVLGMTQSMTGNPGMTGLLSVKYRAPTPLHTELRFVGEVTRVDGRKIFTTGQLFAGELLTAEADGLFISVDFARFGEMMLRRDEGR